MKYGGGKRLRRSSTSLRDYGVLKWRETGGEGLKGKWGKQSWLFAGIGELLNEAIEVGLEEVVLDDAVFLEF